MSGAGVRIRAIRVKKRLRQADVAARAGVSRATVSKIERGMLDGVTVSAIVAVSKALGANVELTVRYMGADLDRLVNARHAALHESAARSFSKLPGWLIAPEVSYSVYGERGVIDILAWHAATRTLLVVELKTAIVDVSALMGKLDQKRRLASIVGRQRGWHPSLVAAWVIVSEGKTNRRVFATHRETLRAAFPSDGRTMRAWVRRPTEPVVALSFWSDASDRSAKGRLERVSRVRMPRASAA